MEKKIVFFPKSKQTHVFGFGSQVGGPALEVSQNIFWQLGKLKVELMISSR